MSKKVYHMGLDIGSTTIKIVITDEYDNMLYHQYRRHLSDMRNTLTVLIKEAYNEFPDAFITINVTGSGGISVSQWLEVDFIQEVIASTECIKTKIPETNVAIELGGEDAKLTFFDNGIDQRMNETCAGGTGAFIDQMAVVLQTDAAGLNEMAKNYKTIYPIAARCGVFAKTDVLPLLNEGAAKEDIAVSIFQAVVDQTIGGLACGRTISGNVAFLGGPLFFLSELRNRFIETLSLTPNEVIFPEHPQLFVAMGAALVSKKSKEVSFKSIIDKVEQLQTTKVESEIEQLPRLFESEKDYEEFKERHSKEGVLNKKEFSLAEGELYLGLDVGSTTTKAILIDKDDNLLFESYSSNLGNPVKSVLLVLEKIYAAMPKNAYIANSCITGYGEGLIKAALGVDEGEVETVAHFTAARYFVPNVSFILDIGGQDMKCMYVRNGAIDKIILNEACSSGCGSFIENFAKSVQSTVQDFASTALKAEHPVDLGSRCTVFMNSKVKQAQKEGASVSDISAGLSYSVVRNALYKVIKMSSVEDLGEHVVVQGGAFFNDAVLRAFELSVGSKVTRFAISGHMGAFGSALIAKERSENGKHSAIIKSDAIASFKMESINVRCKRCSNHCLLTVNKFGGSKKHYITGNRCEKGVQEVEEANKLPNLYAYKNMRLFEYYIPLNKENASRGVVGIPRVLNIYENYPFWFTLFTNLGFRVEISDKSSKELFNTGLETIPSQTVCYPAKIVHGHIMNLISKGIKRIFYPCIQKEVHEEGADNNYNCPVVCSYPEVIRLNVDALVDEKVEFMGPFLPLNDYKYLENSLVQMFQPFNIPEQEVRIAARKADAEMKNFKNDIRMKGEETLEYIEKHGIQGVVLSGRPYHIDPEINHGIPELITSNGLAVLTEDSIAHLATVERPMNAVDQWTYHSRLYKAASFVSEHDNIELIQLNSFGCGLDAVTTEQVYDILNRHDKLYTVIKIDEGSNLGAVRIRIRSLIAAIQDRKKRGISRSFTPAKKGAEFTKEMKDTHTIIIPQLSPIHIHLMKEALAAEGYKVKVLETTDRNDIECGLKHINNDACFPAIVAVGQLLNYVMSPECDTERVAVLISQTAGGCRATNYIGWLKNALNRAGLSHIPVLSFNLHGMETHEGFKVTMPMIRRMVMGILYGDLLMRMLYRCRPYEKVKGETEAVYHKWADICARNVYNYNWRQFKKDVYDIVEEFDNIPMNETRKPRVGIVGEILIKFHPDANNKAVEVIEREGGEAVVPDFMDFVLYSAYDDIYRSKYMAGSKIRKYAARYIIWMIERKRNIMRKALRKSKHFDAMPDIFELAHLAEKIVSLGNQSGEGWLLTAEMVELIEGGVGNILCVQPFACLPNHVTGKGVMKALRVAYDNVNIAAVDYDPGASEVNQLNRIKLLMSVAQKNLAITRKEI